jgi:heavy metal translocating P-type ATPase
MQAATSECVFCSLPLGRRPVVATVDGALSTFCCYGCVLAFQVTRARGDSGAATAILVRLGLAIFFAMNVMMVSLPTYGPYVFGPDADPADGQLFLILRVLALCFATPVLLLLGWPILNGALRSVRNGFVTTDALILLGTFAAYCVSVLHTVRGGGDVYFDTAALLLVLVTVGRYLEAQAKAQAGAAVRAHLSPGPILATRVSDMATERVAPELLIPGDIVRVGPGDAFPTDGCILSGTGGVDEAMLTGESRPVTKAPGQTAASGTCSVDGLFEVRVGARAADSAAARVADLLVAARQGRTPAQRSADRVAAFLLPTVTALAIAAGLWWTWSDGLERGVLVALAVLVVSCPCGLGIATPIAVWTGLTTAARHGVVVRSAAALERIAAIDHVLFDKTGTLTERTPRLVAVEPNEGSLTSERELLAIAAALENGLSHPLAKSIVEASRGRTTAAAPPSVEEIRIIPGLGVSGVIEGNRFTAGSPRFARQELGAVVEPGEHRGEEGTSVLVWTKDQLLGRLRFCEAPRPETASTLLALKKLGLRIGLVSGDASASAVVPAMIPESDAQLGLLPEDKVVRVRNVAGTVAMVGDGINDAPALAAAAVGIAVGDATDLARMTADVVILGNGLQRLPWLVTHARRTRRIIGQSLFWVIAYNSVALAFATAGKLNPVIAAVAMLASSFAVIANARRLQPSRDQNSPSHALAPIPHTAGASTPPFA